MALKKEADGTAYRLLGVGISNLCAAAECDPKDFVDRGAEKRVATERAMDRVRARFGREAVGKGRGISK
jgi:DNA polymerase-4